MHRVVAAKGESFPMPRPAKGRELPWESVTVTVVIPAYNEVHTAERLLESVRVSFSFIIRVIPQRFAPWVNHSQQSIILAANCYYHSLTIQAKVCNQRPVDLCQNLSIGRNLIKKKIQHLTS